MFTAWRKYEIRQRQEVKIQGFEDHCRENLRSYRRNLVPLHLICLKGPFLSSSHVWLSQVRFGVCFHRGRRRRHTELGNFDLFLTAHTGGDTSFPHERLWGKIETEAAQTSSTLGNVNSRGRVSVTDRWRMKCNLLILNWVDDGFRHAALTVWESSRKRLINRKIYPSIFLSF